jgi:hypothetical protein
MSNAMEFVLKLTPDHAADGADAVDAAIASVGAGSAAVSKIFPDQITGNRARLYSVRLPESLPAPDADRILAAIRALPHVEYVESPQPKRPL